MVPIEQPSGSRIQDIVDTYLSYNQIALENVLLDRVVEEEKHSTLYLSLNLAPSLKIEEDIFKQSLDLTLQRNLDQRDYRVVYNELYAAK